eukprot:CAMPEP_0184865830 /NCGR_PEP_ID=MMETSP0580-20130426/19250_1 /TAXON_ID=1118495 /ORGANISM="Dactyliosolen fragilissimus" /LENGTH=415 /DNA_ID=CAMNT_0027365169 /DNA_START=235 /DNA_END=1482 /DNA_ORIENTATION=+
MVTHNISFQSLVWAFFCLIQTIHFSQGFVAIRHNHGTKFVLSRISVPIYSTKSSESTDNNKSNGNQFDGSVEPTYGLYDVQEELITKRGVLEEKLMSRTHRPLEAHTPKVKGMGAGGGFGGGGKSSGNKSNAALKAEGKAHAKILQSEGVVRIDNVLSEDVVDELKRFVLSLREMATMEVSAGKADVRQRFADVLLRKNRCDLTIPLGHDIVYQSLNEILRKSAVGQTMSSLMGKDSTVYELSCLISDPGSDRQVVHPDTPCGSDDEQAVLYTCFVALQDVKMNMGPTVWIPNTHNVKSHKIFNDKEEDPVTHQSPKDHLLSTSPSVLGLLPKGSCAIFDSRLLHCGTANTSENDTRALFYFSIKHPKVSYPGNPASIRPALGGKMKLSMLDKELKLFEKGKACPTLDALAATLR